ncbi:hypothetical protein B5X24_HaOG212443 [Helicoverpa armigera]|uniref:Uncharacterized protein n=1 Tax=Helicoverpa armigera TaxID=29058 RepID=A0A2W1BG66_HELAM|nr:hypothetical protein B5X24_HaOG212443 [Helicoverpa armigera]
MREIPECLNRRYLMLDKLIKDLSSNLPPPGSVDESASCDNNQVGIKMMCDFWNILQDDPECNLTQEVQQRLCGEADCSGMYGPARVDCFRASKDQDSNKGKELPVNRVTRIRVEKDPKSPNRHGCCANSTDGDKLPLSQVLCNLKEAASYDKKCNVRVGELMTAQAELKEQIQILEEREKQGGELLKQADAMWSCMEESYKKKVAESQDRYAVLTKELKEIEQSANKWRKNKKDLEFQMQNITQCNEDIKEKIKQKKNDLKIMDLEIIDFKNRIESNDKDLYKAKNSYKAKKEASDARIATIASEMTQVEKKLAVEYKHKADKEQEGVQYVKEAREDLQKICRVLLQKKLENEDLQAEKEALIQDIDLLKQTCDNCKEKCANKEKSIEEEIKKVEADLIEFRKKCIKCHECTDTIDVRKFCTDCPRCLAERDCLYEGDHCSLDHSMDCVCMSVKQKFLDNVFDNMYTVLERQSKTCPGKAVADCVLNCLKRSRNGKLNEETRKVLQEFILSTVKKNLNLTIVGGAVKTRCEMDPETYKQLMVCLKEVAVTKPVKEDKGTGSRKEPCRRWGGPSECHCPKGPKACICTKKALPPPTDPVSCGPQPADEKESPSKICPVREPLACSLDCGMLGLPGASDLKREPCAGQSCAFSKNSKNMRAAQCMLGTEALASIHHHPTPPLVPALLATDKKVPSVPEQQSGVLTSSRRPDFDCDCSNLPMKYLLSSNTSQNKICRYCACSSNYVSRESRNPFVKKIRKKGNIINICRNSRSDNDTSLVEDVQLGLDVGFKISQRNKTIINKPDDDIKIILCPKFQHASCDDKIEKTLGTSDVKATIIESTHLKLKHKSSAKVLQKCKSFEASFVGRKVGETVKQLMKDIVIPHMPPTNNLSSSEVEWVTLKSLYKEISSLTKLEDLSTDTVNEVEVKCETLEASKEFRLLNKNTPEVKSISILSNIVKSQQSMSDKEASDKKSFDAVISETIHKPQKCGNVGAEELKIKLLEDIRQTYNISVETSLENVKDRELNGRKINNTRKCLVKLEEKELDPYECNCIKTQNRNPANRKSTFRKIKKAAPVDPDNYSQISDTKKGFPISQKLKHKLDKSDNKVKIKAQLKNNTDVLRLNKRKKISKKHASR